MSYLNTVPLVWGFQHSPELWDLFDLRFALPSICAAQMASGEADIGILPVIETARQALDYFPGTGIACHGAVRTILLISKVAFADIKTLAVDAGSRTSVMLSRVILAERYGAEPRVFAHPADLDTMLEQADAALIIGDPALHIDLEALPYLYLDLGAEWVNMTGLPMVFAVWSARKEFIRDDYAEAFRASCRYGLQHMDDIVSQESPIRNVSPELTRAYLTKHIVFELGDRDYEGMRRYLDLALRLDRTTVSGGVAV
ncbi:MAG: menaquinone biosynthesis protein [Acidobacteriota bacterium]